MPNAAYETWIRRLQATCGPKALDGIDPATFADEQGNRRAVDAPLIAWLTGTSAEVPSRPGLDLILWHALAADSPIGVSLPESGPLQDANAPSRGEVAIEVWTERELAAIQALWTLGVSRNNKALRDRAEAAASWCVQELQPDNATAHPWAVNAFVALSAAGDIEADLYAQTLMHNAQVGTGRPGRFASLVLLASLRSLELASE